MRELGRRLVATWVAQGPRFLPFADVATPDLSIWRLLRLSLFQVSAGLALVLLVGTLNRVMIVELSVPASLVAVMVALPVLFAPLRAIVGFRSDHHRCELGWRRVPFIWQGTLLQFGGFAIMPFALLVLGGAGHASEAPLWLGRLAAALAFLLVGSGIHVVQTVGLALATDLTPPSSHPRVVGLMYVMFLLGMGLSALTYGAALETFTPGRLVQVIQSAALAVLVLNSLSLWKQEPRGRRSGKPQPSEPSFRDALTQLLSTGARSRHLVVVAMGTMAFSMADIVLEPFGGQIMGLQVATTTRLSALIAIGGLAGFAYASQRVRRGRDPLRLAFFGALLGIPAFLCVLASAQIQSPGLFLGGNFLIGLGAALFGHGTLTAMLGLAPAGQSGLALGVWGAVQATGAGLGIALSGSLRDGVNLLSQAWARLAVGDAALSGYLAVYGVELALLLVTVVALNPLRSPQNS